MKTSDVYEAIKERCPLEKAMGWDNPGLLVGSNDWKVSKIFVCLDLTDKLLDEAISEGADLIVSHHPMIFSDMKKIVGDDFVGKRIIKLIENHISYIAMHTNYDVCVMGDICADALNMTKECALEETDPEGNGIGFVGSLDKSYTLKELAYIVKEKFDIPYLRYFGEDDTVISKVAICPGSGKGMDSEAISKGADVLITGDIGHHDGIDALMQGLAIIDAGHYGLEHLFIDEMGAFLKERFPNAEIVKERIKMPYKDI